MSTIRHATPAAKSASAVNPVPAGLQPPEVRLAWIRSKAEGTLPHARELLFSLAEVIPEHVAAVSCGTVDGEAVSS